VWLPPSDERVPPWLAVFNGDVLVHLDEHGRYGAGVGRKYHDANGQELSVATEEHLRGRGLARRLVAQAARRVADEGAVATYLHATSNTASARVADAAGFPDTGWWILGLPVAS
jgi:GNAT superfamily N-acetyltransferase